MGNVGDIWLVGRSVGRSCSRRKITRTMEAFHNGNGRTQGKGKTDSDTMVKELIVL